MVTKNQLNLNNKIRKLTIILTVFVMLLMSACSGVVSSSNNTSSSITSSAFNSSSTQVVEQPQIANLIAIEVNKLPSKLVYTPNEVVTTSGGELRLTFSDYNVKYVPMNDQMIDQTRLNLSSIGSNRVTLKYTFKNNTLFTSYNISTVPFVVKLNSVDLDIKESDVLANQQVQLNPIYNPLNSFIYSTKWESSNPLIASVDNNGLVTPLNAGEVIITLTVNDTITSTSRLNILPSEILENAQVIDPLAISTLNISFNLDGVVSVTGATNNSNLRYYLTTDRTSKQNAIDTWDRNTTLASIQTDFGSAFSSGLTLSYLSHYQYLVVVEIDANSNIKAAGQVLIDRTVTVLANDDYGKVTLNGVTYNANVNSGVFEFDSTDYVSTSVQFSSPQVFTLEAWIKTTDSNSGKIIGFETDQTGTGTSGYDRHLYINDFGKVVFGVYDGNLNTATSTTTVNNNTWYHVMATYGGEGTTMRLYVNGVSEATATSAYAQNFLGYWRMGSYSLLSWPKGDGGFYNISGAYYTGLIGDARIYNNVALTQAEVEARFNNTKSRFNQLLLNLDASNINSYPQSGATWFNLANNTLNASIFGPQFDYIDGGIFDFNGSADYVLLGSSSVLKPANALTVEQWLYRESWNQAAIETALSNTDSGGYTIYVENNLINFEVFVNGQYRTISYSLANQVGWFHVVGTFDGRFVRMFVNGIERGVALDLTTNRTITYNNSNATFIGAEAGSSSSVPATGDQANWNWKGKIALTKIYDYALSSSSILQNYNDTKGRFIVYQNLVNYLDAGSTFSNLNSGNKWDSLVGSTDADVYGNYTHSFSNGITFDGTTSQYATLPSVIGVTDFTNTNNYSIEIWFKPAPNQNSGTLATLFEKYTNQIQKYPYAFRYRQNDNAVDILVYDGSNSRASTVTGVVTGGWNQVVGVFDFENDQLKSYLNGVNSGSVGNLTLISGVSTHSNLAGIATRILSGTNPAHMFKGQIGLIRIYNKALSSGEIIQNYNATESRFGSSSILQTNLIVNLEGSNTNSYSGTGNTWTDLAGGDNNATLNSAVYSNTDGGIFDLDNTNHFISIPHDPLLSLSSAGQRTIQLWVKFDELPTVGSGERIVFSKMSSLSDYDGYYLALDVAQPGRLKFVTNTASVDNRMFSTSNVAINTWYLITVIFQVGGTNTIKIYINTTEVLSGQQNSDSFGEPQNNLNIGRFDNESNSGFNGKVGALYFYNSGLSVQQITENFNATKTRYGLS